MEEEGFHIRDAVAEFARLMENKLTAVEERHPEGWGTDDPTNLFLRADDRMDLVYIDLENGDFQSAGERAVDVANWMMMIADNCGVLPEKYGR